MSLMRLSDVRVGVLGLGYVGLPLAAHLARHFPTLGFDIDQTRVDELRNGHDRTREISDEEFRLAKTMSFSTDIEELRKANFYIVTVPTPIDNANVPDLTPLQKASETVGKVISKGDIVVYESTVYPGATEEICIPIIERVSGLKYNIDFFAGYSPERANPGDKEHTVATIRKVTSGSTPDVADLVDSVYATVVTVGTHKASDIRVAEAAKVIENIQRDVNIALVNELAQLFNTLGIDTREVLAAAGTKWNFHAYMPGLVGGHCIGVDPYYLTYKAQQVGFHPEMILAGRRINDGMAGWVARDILKAMLRRKQRVDTARVLVLGFTFKENCPDTRNTKIADLVKELQSFVGSVTVYDPLADPREAQDHYGVAVQNALPGDRFDAVVFAVRHDEIIELSKGGLDALMAPGALLYDIKNVLPAGQRHAGV